MFNRITVYNEKILKELKEKYPQKWNKLKYSKKEKWLTKEEFPTYRQLVEISKVFNIPFGYLFVENLPEKKLPIPYFRTKNNIEESSEDLYDTVMIVSKLQTWAREILEEWGHTKLPFTKIFSINDDPKVVAKEMKKILNIKEGWNIEHKQRSETFRSLVEKLENIGVFVIVSGIVGNNTRRVLKVEEFRGFVLYDDIAPFVFINNNDFVNAKIFTLIHEFVHILVGESAAFDLRELIPANNDLEKFCDRCSAEFLVPEDELAKLTKDKSITDTDIENLAQHFKVSQIVIARRLLDIGKINEERFKSFYETYLSKINQQKKQEGGNFYEMVKYRYSERFLQIIKLAIQDGTISYRDAYRLLSFKPKTLEGILAKVSDE